MLDLTELSEMEKKVSPAPWIARMEIVETKLGDLPIGVLTTENGVVCNGFYDNPFVALSRNLCRPMILEIERLRKELKEANWILEGLRK